MTLNLFGKNTPDKGLYGHLSMSYYDESMKSRYKNSVEDFTKEFKLGYMGNLYSPKLLDYRIDTILKYQDITNKNQSAESIVEAKTFDYNMNLDFLKKSRFPLTIYKNKSDSPYTRIEETNSSQFFYRSDNEGLNGNIKLDDLNINYTIAKNDLETEEQNYITTSIQDRYGTSLKYNKKNYKFNISYQHLNRDSTTNYLDGSTDDLNTTQIDDTVNISFQTDITKSVSMDSSFSLFSSEYLQYKNDTTYADIGLNWRPKEKYSGGIYISTSTIESQYDQLENNTTTLEEDTFETFNFTQNFNYKLLDNLNISQSLSKYIYDTQSDKGEISNFQLKTSYRYMNQITQDSYLTMNSSIDYQKLLSTDENKIVHTTDESNTNIYTLNLTPNLRTNFESINSKSSLGLEYFDTRSSDDEYTQRYGLSFDLNSRFLYIAGNNFSCKIAQSNNKDKLERKIFDGDEDPENDVYETTTDSGSVTTTKLKDTLDFSLRLTNKGTITFKTGLDYSNTSSDNSRIETGKALTDIFLKYSLTRKLNLSSKIYSDIDILNDVVTNNGNILLSYIVGKTQITASYKFYKTIADANSGFQDWSRSRFDAKLTRRF